MVDRRKFSLQERPPAPAASQCGGEGAEAVGHSTRSHVLASARKTRNASENSCQAQAGQHKEKDYRRWPHASRPLSPLSQPLPLMAGRRCQLYLVVNRGPCSFRAMRRLPAAAASPARHIMRCASAASADETRARLPPAVGGAGLPPCTPTLANAGARAVAKSVGLFPFAPRGRRD